MAPETEYGVLAQLVERQVRNLKVRGSIPLCSTEEGRPDGLPSSVERTCLTAALRSAAGSAARFSSTISLTLHRAAVAAHGRPFGLPSSVEHTCLTAALSPAAGSAARLSSTISLTLHRAAVAAAGGRTVSPLPSVSPLQIGYISAAVKLKRSAGEILNWRPRTPALT